MKKCKNLLLIVLSVCLLAGGLQGCALSASAAQNSSNDKTETEASSKEASKTGHVLPDALSFDLKARLQFFKDALNGGAGFYAEDSYDETIGVIVRAEKVNSDKTYVVLTQYDPDADCGELEFEEFYGLQKKIGNEWKSIDMVPEAMWCIINSCKFPKGESIEFRTNWQELYGTHGTGSYCIPLTVWERHADGTKTEHRLYAYFVITK
ncbi:MAG: hypothetical protein IJL97_04025 [Lachnospiraceae bacterium]|nr:hypothetical protein [Lachnospiraceae bacterium]